MFDWRGWIPGRTRRRLAEATALLDSYRAIESGRRSRRTRFHRHIRLVTNEGTVWVYPEIRVIVSAYSITMAMYREISARYDDEDLLYDQIPLVLDEWGAVRPAEGWMHVLGYVQGIR